MLGLWRWYYLTLLLLDIVTLEPRLQNVVKAMKNSVDLLALVFTVAKVLYVAGALEPLVALSHLVEPARCGRLLHETPVKNEPVKNNQKFA